MWDLRLEVTRYSAMRDSSLIYPVFGLTHFKAKNSVNIYVNACRQQLSLQLSWPACSDSYASCGMEEDRCSSSLAKPPSETFSSKQSFPCFWKPRVCFPTLHKGVEPQFSGPGLNKECLQLSQLSVFKKTSLPTPSHSYWLTGHTCLLNYTQS